MNKVFSELYDQTLLKPASFQTLSSRMTVEYTSTKQGETTPAVHRAFHTLEAVDLALHLTEQ